MPADLAEAGRLVIGRAAPDSGEAPAIQRYFAAPAMARAAINALLRLPQVRRLLRGDVQMAATSGALEFPRRFAESGDRPLHTKVPVSARAVGRDFAFEGC